MQRHLLSWRESFSLLGGGCADPSIFARGGQTRGLSSSRECREKAWRLSRSSSSEPWCAPALSFAKCCPSSSGCLLVGRAFFLLVFIRGFSLCHLVRLWPRRRGASLEEKKKSSANISITLVVDTGTGRAGLEWRVAVLLACIQFISGGAIYDIIWASIHDLVLCSLWQLLGIL